MTRFGATPEQWDHFVSLGLTADLLPVVSNPNATISPNSKMQGIGKTPSIYNRERQVVGLPKWTNVLASEHQVSYWKLQPDYGICLQTRKVRAFDIDVEDNAIEIADAITRIAGPLPVRIRGNRLLLGFTYNRPLTKHVIPVEHGIIEVLADGQQFIAAGTHPSGEAYRWSGGTNGLPDSFPTLTGDEFKAVLAMLEAMFSTGETRIARERRAGSGTDLKVHDAVAEWLLENWETYDVGPEGEVFIECPFAGEHTSDSGPTSTAYFPGGTGGYQQGHFVCLHAHCVGRTDSDFLDASGFNLSQFEDLTEGISTANARAGSSDRGSAEGLSNGTHVLDAGSTEAPLIKLDWPALVRDKGGKIEPTAFNIRTMLQDGSMVFRRISYDTFTDNLLYRKIDEYGRFLDDGWQRFTDADMVDLRVEMECRGMKPMSKDLVRECAHAAGIQNIRDSALDWLSTVRWDGVERVRTFASDCWGWKPSEYSEAVSRYTWTALAGRLLEPGVRADMAPILVGAQGIRKTSAIQAMVPKEEFYAEIRLDDKDDDISRKLRGKMIGELEELRGLNSRAIEEIKAFVSRKRESWVPKFKEFENFFHRRCILVGSTNDTQFLADPTGERRWLPGECSLLDVERIVETREQLWAEGAHMFMMDGVAWADAEHLAEREHPRYKIGDSWEHSIARWIDEETVDGQTPLSKGYVTVGEALGSIGVRIDQVNRGYELRMAKVLRHMGLKEITVTEGQRSWKGYERA